MLGQLVTMLLLEHLLSKEFITGKIGIPVFFSPLKLIAFELAVNLFRILFFYKLH